MIASMDQMRVREFSTWFLLVSTFAAFSFGWSERISCDIQCDVRIYNTSSGPVADKLNVHLVPHTHDDVGWLKTVDQYFVGSNNSIQVAAVQYILDSVISALQADPNRKFIYVEQAFFQRWWRQQTSTTKKAVRKLVDRGQLEFINGGWCMHDEASTHYIDMIDQTTLGHRYIKEQFGKVPRIGWQIDPFGHSAVQAYLLGAEVGFDAVFFARADYQDVLQRRKDRTMEAIWRGSKSLGSSAQIFAGILANHYEPPDGFSFDIGSSNPPVQDDSELFDYNLEERVNLFVQRAQEQAKEFRTNHLMWTMGDDFAYEYAHTWFKQLDKLVHYVNKDGRVNAFYSTPSLYVDMKEASNETWPLKLDDYFPYADSENGYWTGYFTSRPALKGYVRKLSAYLQVARQLELIVGRKDLGLSSDSLEEALAVLQHHDGVSGTEQQHVASDYTKRLFLASVESESLINAALAQLITGKSRLAGYVGRLQMVTNEISNNYGHQAIKETGSSSMNFQQCPLSNISYCPPSEADLTGKSLAVIAYNPLGWERKETVRITVSDYKLDVFDSSGNLVPSQIIPVSQTSTKLRERHLRSIQKPIVSDEPLFELLFECSTPPLGYSTYYVKPSQNDSYSAEHSLIEENIQSHGAHAKSNSVQFTFSSSTGLLERLKRKDGVEVSLEQSFCWYNASDGNTEETRGQASGAYVFRPNTSSCFALGYNVTTSSVKGSLVEEVHQQLTSWVSQVVRVFKDSENAEVEFTVGPIPFEDQLGKEIVTKLSTDLESNGVFYTDSNGRDFIKRVRDYRSDWELEVHEEIAGNYYPVNSGIFLSDNSTDFSILVDRSIGGSSISDGELELMVHRRLLHDDGKGVAEALNETTCLDDSSTCEGLVVRGTFLIDVRPVNESAFWRRNLIQRKLFPLQLVFSVVNDEDGQFNISEYSAMEIGYQLPPNVALVTLQELHDSSVLLRLAHLFEIHEDDLWSNVAVVNLQNIFANHKIKKVEELSLSANQKKSEMKVKQWQIENDDMEGVRYIRSSGFLEDGYQIELRPMEIRTFSVTLE
ncbi:hypothetical protein GOP47_0015332 [Adiantum capillus-veneris]|uniref:Alpha-mannosidase n=1 Tax=Adiantum capillus-veneris TaxID=13818 RepID=A0A9D4UKF0_ADICA|nr:hypothetical protein GOP47_0015332 [Adiantum capillus-veneris]